MPPSQKCERISDKGNDIKNPHIPEEKYFQMLYLSSTSLLYSMEDFVNIHPEVYEQVNRAQYTFVNKYINK